MIGFEIYEKALKKPFIMEGKHLIVSISPMPPFVDYVIEDDAIVLKGCFGQLWATLEERLGFSSQYMVESYSMGVLNFQNKRRDVLLRPSVISSDDVDQFDFTFPVGSTWYEVYLKDSDEINTSYSFVRNWSNGIWIFTIAMVFTFPIILYIMLYLADKFSLKDMYIVPTYESAFRLIHCYAYDYNKFILPKNWRKKKTEERKLRNNNDRSLGNCFVATIAIFCSQGLYVHTNITSIRILILSFLFFGMIMYIAYSALLVSQLTLGERFLPFDTLEEIPTRGQGYSLCVRSESYPYLYFTENESKNELKKKWKHIVNHEPCPSDGILGLDSMCEPYVAFLETPPVMKERILDNINCKMTNLKGRYFNADLSLIILKGFEDKARKELNIEILRYQEVGVLSHLREKWIRQEKISPMAQNQRMQVTFEHIEGVLIAYAFSMGLSCFVLFMEVFFYLVSIIRRG